MFVYNVSVMSITMKQLKLSAEFPNKNWNLIYSATTESAIIFVLLIRVSSLGGQETSEAMIHAKTLQKLEK